MRLQHVTVRAAAAAYFAQTNFSPKTFDVSSAHKNTTAMKPDDSQGPRQTTSTYYLVRKMAAAMQPDDSRTI